MLTGFYTLLQRLKESSSDMKHDRLCDIWWIWYDNVLSWENECSCSSFFEQFFKVEEIEKLQKNDQVMIQSV